MSALQKYKAEAKEAQATLEKLRDEHAKVLLELREERHSAAVFALLLKASPGEFSVLLKWAEETIPGVKETLACKITDLRAYLGTQGHFPP